MLKKTFGVVEKIIDDSTIVILDIKKRIHPLYQKSIKVKKRFMVHKAIEAKVNVGDRVCAVECAPISKRKKLVLLTI